MKLWRAIVVLGSIGCTLLADTLIVPSANVSQAGSGQEIVGFTMPGGLEFAFGKNNFTGPVQITGVAFRPDERGRSSMDVVIPNFTIRMTTYVGTPSSLNGSYSLNATSDDAVVFSGAVHWVGSGLFGTSPNPFLMAVNFSQPFIYDPKRGDLLMDIESSGPTSQSFATSADLTAHNNFGIGYTYTDFGGGVGSTGSSLVTQFNYVAVPEPLTAVLLLTAGILGIVRKQK